jgi:very-short-patch-repair endonuclease
MRRTLITTRARAMRKAMTEPEAMLWSRLRGRNPDKPTFRRQHPFGSIILDFYCPAARLAVEVDGATHWDDDAQAKDAARDRWPMSQGVRVYRIPAGRIYRDLSGVTDGVLLYALALIAEQRRRTELAPSPSPYLPREAAGGGPSAERSEEPMVEGASHNRGLRDEPWPAAQRRAFRASLRSRGPKAN